MRLLTVSSLALALILGLVASNQSYGADDPLLVPDYTTSSELPEIASPPLQSGLNSKIMTIFVVFPGYEPSSGYPGIYQGIAWADSICAGTADHLFNQSRNLVDLQPVVPENPDHPNGWWVADHQPNWYGDANSTGRIYQSHYLGGEFAHLGELQAEILFKIYDAYVTVGGNPNPFDGVGLINFIYHGYALWSEEHPILWGYGFNSVDRTTFAFLSGMDDGLMSCATELVGSVGTDCLPGCQQNEIMELTNPDTGLPEITEANFWSLSHVVSHEMGHYFGLGHDPSTGSCGSGYFLGREQYFYGPYTNISLKAKKWIGRVAYHPMDLVALGWVDQVEVTESTKNIELGDIRLGKSVLKVPIPGTSNQYFLLSYHGGNGLDAKLDSGGHPVYRSHGLAVWHIVDVAQGTDVWDLESAWGRFSDPDTVGFGEGAWETPTATSGFDNLDIWVDHCEFPPGEDLGPYYDYFDNYRGSMFDFFGADSGKTRFSFASNPNTYGQTGNLRRSYQDILNSMVIRINQETSDHVKLDILLGVAEEITAPTNGTAAVVGQPLSIAWTTEYESYIGFCQVEYTTDDQAQFPDWQVIQNRVPVTAGGVSWTPQLSDVSSAGKVRVRFRATNGVMTYTEMDGHITIVPPPVAKFTNVSGGTNLNYSGQPTCAIGFDSNTDDKKDLFVGIEPGQLQSHAYQQTGLGSGGVPEFGSMTLFSPQSGARAVVSGDYDNDGDMDLCVTAVSGAKIYRKDGQNYTEVSSTLGLASLTDKATAAVWGDYDDDGWLDLYVVRSGGNTDPPTFPNVFGEQHRLFRNEVALGNGFVDVTSASGLSGAAIGSVSASFIDFDRDGDLDLFVANLQEPPTGPGGLHSLLYVNQGNGTFTEEYEARISSDVYYATAQKWSDVDNDGDFDLVMTTHEYKPEIHFNDGFGGFTLDPIKRLNAAEGHAGLEVFDQDLDGWNDIFCVANDGVNTNRFYSGVETVTGVDYVETSASVGMDSVSIALGSAATDFTRDGDPDLFLGKDRNAGEYFYITNSQAEEQWIGRDYVKIRIESPYAANNRAGLGAIVEVTDGTNTWVRSVDGGSGRGGQDDRDLVFGLGENAGTMTATVHWPNGNVQSSISLTKSNEASGETLNLVSDNSPVLVNVSGTSVINPATGTLDWTFSWDSHLPSDSSQDVVEFDQAGFPTPCWPGWPDLTPTTGGVSYSYYQLPNGKYHHQFDIPNADCIRGCGFRFTVSSKISGASFTSAPKTVAVKFCPAQF